MSELIQALAKVGFSPGECVILAFLVWELRRVRQRVADVETRMNAVFKPAPVKEQVQ